MTYRFIKPFGSIKKGDVGLAGGKGLSLGLLYQAGIPIPDGFVVTANAFKRFFDESNIDEEAHAMWDTINVDDMESVERHSEEIQGAIRDSSIPEEIAKEVLEAFRNLGEQFVAVRSSATAEDSAIDSWAGELESYLYIGEKELLDHVKLCWASLYAPRAIIYSVKRNMTWKKNAVAVVVQKMVNADVSGVCFTVNPVTHNRNDMVIETVWGLGETLVQGIVTPDQYLIHKKENVIVDVTIHAQKKMYVRKKNGGVKEMIVSKHAQAQQKLNGKQIVELAEICKKIETHYRYPQDIEWAYAQGKFYIVQSRPITTLK